MPRLAVIVVLIAAAGGAATGGAAADWPHVRGPGYDAHAHDTALANHWPGAGPPVLWTRELGAGYSAFAIAQGRAFTLFQTSAGMLLIALDADTGTELWKERIDWPWQHGGMYPGPYASPTWSEGRVFYATPTGTVGCVSAADGRSHWIVKLNERFGGRRGIDFGYASTPTVEGGRVFLPVGGPNASVAALGAEDGRILWAAGDDPASYCPAYPITLDGRRCIVGFLQNALVLLDAATGERLWRERLSSNYDEHAAWPLFDGRHLLIASPFHAGARVYRLAVGEQGVTAKALWSGRQLSNDVSSSVLHDGAVFGFDIHQAQSSVHRPARGSFKCLDLATGQLRWETEVGQASLIHADVKLIVWTETGTLLLVRASSDRYEELARAQVLSGGGMCWAAPALAGKRLIVRDHKRAVCLYLGATAELDPARRILTITHTDKAFDWTRLVPKESGFPNDAPSSREVAIWFAASAGGLAASAAIALIFRRWLSRRYAVAGFALLAFVLGAAGTTALGAWLDTFALTWPVSLYVAFRVTLVIGRDRAARGWRRQILARLALVLFIARCYGYYRLCMAVGYAVAWGFLGGFVPASPIALAANRVGSQRIRWLLDVIGFTVYFWTSAYLPGWKARLSS